MISEFVKAWDTRKGEVRAAFAAKHPEDYKSVVQAVVNILGDCFPYGSPDAARIHEIDEGNYQGTLVYVIAAEGYQPDKFWYVKVGYGSCSGCDTLCAIGGYADDAPTESQLDEYMTLALHVLQGLKEMGGESV